MKSFLGFLILWILLFSTVFISPAFAKGVTTSGIINYKQIDTNFDTKLDITLNNTDSYPAVVNYYTILLPFQGIENIKTILEGALMPTTIHKQRNGTEIVVNLRSLIIPKKKKANLIVSFNSLSPMNSDWGYGKIVSQIKGLNISKITFEYDSNKPKISNVEGSQYRELLTSNNRLYEFSDITNYSIIFNIGNPISFEYNLSKTYINDSDDTAINEVVIPYTDKTQQFIIKSISPLPTSQRIDSDNNIILGFLVEPKDQIIVKINGYITKKETLKLESQYQQYELDSQGLWNLTNEYERTRLTNFLKDKKREEYPLQIQNYVVQKLSGYSSNTSGDNSFDNVLRSGADNAITRKDSAIPEDYVDLLITLLRINSIPARMVVGILPESSLFTDKQVFHSWVEYYDLDKKEWKTFDPSLSDIYVNSESVNSSPNTVKLLIRGESSTSPKLPFLSSKDLQVKPIGYTSDSIFDFKQESNKITNTGNIPIIITSSSSLDVIIPGTSKELTENKDYILKSLLGDTKTIKNETTSVHTRNLNIYFELVMFIAFLLILLFLSSIYAKIQRLWKRALH